MKSIIVYGTGWYFKTYRDKLPKDTEIVAYCDSDENKATSVSKQLFLGKEILMPKELENRLFDNIWICILDWNTCWEIFCGLKKYNIDLRKVKFLNRVDYEENGLTYYIDEDKNLISQWRDIKVKEKNSDADPAEIFLYDTYNLILPSKKEKPSVLIDIGMNLGYTTLYFAEKDYVKRVYG